MQLYFIRHAQSSNNELFARTGSNLGRVMDPPISSLGIQQAKLLAGYLQQMDSNSNPPDNDLQNRAELKITHLYTSLFVRSIQTGEFISDALGLPLVGWPEIHETGGVFLEDEVTNDRIGKSGPNRSYFDTHHPNLVLPEMLNENGWWDRPFEAYEDRLPRAQKVVNQLKGRHGNSVDRVIIISHGGFYNYFLMAILGITSRSGFWFLMHNTAISRFDFRDDEVVLVYHNRVDHLPAELIT